MASEQEPTEIYASKRFTQSLVAVCVLSLVLLVAMILLSLALPEPTKSHSDTMGAVSKAFFICVGALAGLLGGKLT